MSAKRLYLLRHAKSSWKDMSLCDYDRPLNKRGKTDVVMMAERMHHQQLAPDIIVSSGALRAKRTAKTFCKALECHNLVFDDRIYEASVATLLELLHVNFQQYDSVMMVGHNPGLTMLCSHLSSTTIENIPTCGIVALSAKKISLEKHSMEVEFFDYPKKG